MKLKVNSLRVLFLCTIILTSTYFLSYIYADSYYEVVQNIVIENSGAGAANNLEISINIGQDSFTPYSRVEYKKIEPNPNEYTTDIYGNTYALYNSGSLKSNSSMTFKVTRVIRCGIPANKISLSGTSYSFALSDQPDWLIKEQKGIDSKYPPIIAKANSLILQKDTQLEKLKKYFNFVNLNMVYDDNAKYANKGSISAFDSLHGVCEEYATLLTALCRAEGIPARTVTGYRLSDELYESLYKGDSILSEKSAHAWVEVYTPEIGYIPVEPTFTLSVNGQRSVYSDGIGYIDTNDYIPTALYNSDKSTVDLKYTYLGLMPNISTDFNSNSTIRQVSSTHELSDSTFMYSDQIIETSPAPNKNVFQIIWDGIVLIFTGIVNWIGSLFK